MRILILGATGRTGKHLLQEALNRGIVVHALVRDPSKLEKHANLLCFPGSADNEAELERALVGCEAILSALNISRTSDWPWSPLRTPKNFLSTVMNHLVKLAPKYGIFRIIFTSAWGAAETRDDVPAWFKWFIEHSNIRYPYDDHARQEAIAGKSSLEWTAVRPSGLTNFKKKKGVVVSLGNSPRPKLTISRPTVAGFMLDILQTNQFVRQCPVISTSI